MRFRNNWVDAYPLLSICGDFWSLTYLGSNFIPFVEILLCSYLLLSLVSPGQAADGGNFRHGDSEVNQLDWLRVTYMEGRQGGVILPRGSCVLVTVSGAAAQRGVSYVCLILPSMPAVKPAERVPGREREAAPMAGVIRNCRFRRHSRRFPRTSTRARVRRWLRVT